MTRSLAIGLVTANEPGAFFVHAAAGEVPQGLSAEIAGALAAALDRTPEVHFFPNSGACTQALEAGELDLAPLPRDAARAARVDFGPDYLRIRSRLLAAPDCMAADLGALDTPSARIIAIRDTTTLRATAAALPRAQIVVADSAPEAEQMLHHGAGDALALGEDALAQIRARMPGTRLLDPPVHEVVLAPAMRRDGPELVRAVEAAMARLAEAGEIARLTARWAG